MISRALCITVLSAIALLSGCTTTPAPDTGPAPVEDRGRRDTTPEFDVTPPGAEQGTRARAPVPDVAADASPRVDPEPSGLRSDYPAVHMLAQRAEAMSARGDGPVAIANLERALGIEPSNPWLWSRLAALHFEQRDLVRARAAAERSNALAKDASALRDANRALLDRIEALMGAGQRPGD